MYDIISNCISVCLDAAVTLFSFTATKTHSIQTLTNNTQWDLDVVSVYSLLTVFLLYSSLSTHQLLHKRSGHTGRVSQTSKLTGSREHFAVSVIAVYITLLITEGISLNHLYNRSFL